MIEYGWLIPCGIFILISLFSLLFNNNIFENDFTVYYLLIIIVIFLIIFTIGLYYSQFPSEVLENLILPSDNVFLTKLISCQTKWQRVGHGKIYFLKNKIIYIPVIDSLVRKGNSILIINLKEIKNFELKTDKYSTKFYINLRKDTIKFFVINDQIDDYKNIAGTIGIRVIIK